MATFVTDIKSRDWQLSTAGFGVVAEGLADIRQCLDIILRTARGSDPLRPEFGSNIYQYVDGPHSVAIPSMVRAIIEAVELWEQRVEVVSIRHLSIEHNIQFFITYRLVDEDLIDQLRLLVRGGFIDIADVQAGSLILEGFFPADYVGKRLFITFTGNGNVVPPAIPANGFGSPLELFNWVQGNWGGYGRWVLLPDRVVLYMNPDLFATASLQITASITYEYVAPLFALDVEQHYKIRFEPNGAAASPAAPSFISLDEMLLWVRQNWADYGTWEIQSGTPATQGDFDPLDFDQSEFDTGTAEGYNLVLYSNTVTSAILDVTIEDD